jgi:hypothetical protein
MGAPTSSILAETCIQYAEHKHISPVLIKQQIISYFKYADGILMIHDRRRTNMEHTRGI